MDKINIQKSILPELNGRALDFIKIVAAICMVCDHIDFMWFDRHMVMLNMIGRTTFPLFCYALAMAIFKKGETEAPRYGWRVIGLRILLFAIPTEFISHYTRHLGELNVLFTLALAAVIAGVSYRLKDWQLYLLGIFAVALNAFPAPIEFSAVGVMFPAAILMVLRGRRFAMPFLILLAVSLNASDMLAQWQQYAFGDVVFALSLAGFFSIVPPWVFLQLASSFPQNGRLLHKYFLYIFYPAHMALLWAIGHFVLKVI